MKAVFLFLTLLWFSETSTLTSRPGQLQNGKEVSSSNLATYSNPKVMENGNLFSPRMDYDEWTPLGRGDPLKNDPTYDYVPPVLDRVHYWMDPSKRTPDPPLPNSGVLVIGSRTESTFTTRPTTPRYQVFQSKESQADSRIDTSSLLDPFFKLMDASQFNLNFNTNGNSHYKPTPNRMQRPQYQSVKQKPQTLPPQALQRPPYTMLMPPPPPSSVTQSVTNFITTQVTTISDRTQSQVTTAPTASTTSTTSSVPKNVTTINPTVLANTENVFKPVAIAMPGQVEPIGNETLNEVKTTIKYRAPPKKSATEGSSTISSVSTVFNNKKPSNGDQLKPSSSDRQTVPSSHSHAHLTTISNFKQKPKEPVNHQVHASANENRINNLSESLLQLKEPNHKGHHHTKAQGSWNRENELRISSLRATTSPTITTIKTNVLTTDTMLKHYKQSPEPVKAPFYLIIQGHSKVKTYGANKNPINKLLTSNEIKYDDDDGKRRYPGKYEREARRLIYASLNHDTLDGVNKIEDFEKHPTEEIKSFTLMTDKNAESLEEAFGKSNGGSSKKRYLGSNHRRKRSFQKSGRWLRSVPPEETTESLKVDCGAEGRNATGVVDNLDLESLIAISDDYDPEDVASILLKQEGGPGSGFGGFAGSIFSRSETEAEEI